MSLRNEYNRRLNSKQMRKSRVGNLDLILLVMRTKMFAFFFSENFCWYFSSLWREEHYFPPHAANFPSCTKYFLAPKIFLSWLNHFPTSNNFAINFTNISRCLRRESFQVAEIITRTKFPNLPATRISQVVNICQVSVTNFQLVKIIASAWHGPSPSFPS